MWSLHFTRSFVEAKVVEMLHACRIYMQFYFVRSMVLIFNFLFAIISPQQIVPAKTNQNSKLWYYFLAAQQSYAVKLTKYKSYTACNWNFNWNMMKFDLNSICCLLIYLYLIYWTPSKWLNALTFVCTPSSFHLLCTSGWAYY